MRVANFIISNFNAASMAASITSPEISLNGIFGWSAQFIFTGSPVGSLKAQVSNDQSYLGGELIPAPTNWTDLSNSSTSISAAGDITYNVNLSFYNWVRFVYTSTSGTGTITGRMNLKGY